MWAYAEEEFKEILEKGDPAADIQAINTFEAEFEDTFGPDIPKPEAL